MNHIFSAFFLHHFLRSVTLFSFGRERGFFATFVLACNSVGSTRKHCSTAANRARRSVNRLIGTELRGQPLGEPSQPSLVVQNTALDLACVRRQAAMRRREEHGEAGDALLLQILDNREPHHRVADLLASAADVLIRAELHLHSSHVLQLLRLGIEEWDKVLDPGSFAFFETTMEPSLSRS